MKELDSLQDMVMQWFQTKAPLAEFLGLKCLTEEKYKLEMSFEYGAHPDDKDFKLLKELLEHQGYNVLEAEPDHSGISSWILEKRI